MDDAGMTTAETIQWVADATNAARNVLGSTALVTHAPQPPYFGNPSSSLPVPLSPSLPLLALSFLRLSLPFSSLEY